MATNSSILAWEIPWSEEPCGLQSMGLRSQTQLATKHNPEHYIVVGIISNLEMI